MRKFLILAAAGFVTGFAGHAFAHDMGMMEARPTVAQATPSAPNTIDINNFDFGPKVITVPVGTTITWINHDDEPHTVVSSANPRIFRSEALDTTDKFSFTFDKVGTYAYFCSIHPQMTGTVVVK